jgi:hypothetical protein
LQVSEASGFAASAYSPAYIPARNNGVADHGFGDRDDTSSHNAGIYDGYIFSWSACSAGRKPKKKENPPAKQMGPKKNGRRDYI